MPNPNATKLVDSGGILIGFNPQTIKFTGDFALSELNGEVTISVLAGSYGALTTAKLWVGDAFGQAVAQAPSGDLSMDDAGVFTVKQIDGVIIDSTATDANIMVADGTQWNSVAMSGDATIDNTGAITVFQSAADFEVLGNLSVDGVYLNSIGANAVAPSVLSVLFGQMELTTTGTGDAFSLPDGLPGQTMTIIYIAEAAGTDTAVVTPTNLGGGFTTITFNDVGDTAQLVFSSDGNWYFVAGSAVAA